TLRNPRKHCLRTLGRFSSARRPGGKYFCFPAWLLSLSWSLGPLVLWSFGLLVAEKQFASGVVFISHGRSTMESNDKPERSQSLTWAAPFLNAFLAALTFLTIPRKPFVIFDEVSEKAVLSYAHEHQLQFGTDIVFTYGPLGFLITRHFFPQGAGLRMAVDVL